MNELICPDLSFPFPTQLVFDKVVSLDWYDGTSAGAAMCSQPSLAFRFDLIALGPCQEQRIFAFSPLAVEDFKQLVELLSKTEAPEWPMWFPKWPPELSAKESLGREIDACIANAKSPKYVVASDSSSKSILAAKRLDGPAQELLKPNLEASPFFDNFDYWKDFVGLEDGPCLTMPK
jgi:hypothetical protein